MDTSYGMTEKEIQKLVKANLQKQKAKAKAEYIQDRDYLFSEGIGLPRLKKLIANGSLPEAKEFMEYENVNFTDHCLWMKCRVEVARLGILEKICLPFSELSCRP